MVIESRACPSCEDSVPPGRLSCPHCGAVLAAVARPLAPDASPEPPVVADDGWDADPGGTTEVRSPWSTARAGAAAEATAEPAAVVESPPPPGAGAYVPPAVEPEPQPAPLADEQAPHVAMAEPVDPPPAPILPRAWDPVAAASGEGVIAAPRAATARVGRIAMPRIDRERVEQTADTVLLVGSFGLVLSFLAPWADVVIGSSGRGYMDTWGLAGSGHIALFLVALGVLALAALENPIGRWLRTGVAGVALGGFVLGLAWPYVVGPLGAGPGALLAWVSGLVLFVAGIISLIVLRHAALPPDV
jgi:hypothetical protein